MSATLLQLLISLVGQAIAEAPTFINDIKALVASIEGTSAPLPNDPPIEPSIAAEEAPLLQQLETPLTSAPAAVVK